MINREEWAKLLLHICRTEERLFALGNAGLARDESRKVANESLSHRADGWPVRASAGCDGANVTWTLLYFLPVVELDGDADLTEKLVRVHAKEGVGLLVHCVNYLRWQTKADEQISPLHSASLVQELPHVRCPFVAS